MPDFYLGSLDSDICASRILKIELKPGQEMQFCRTLVDFCAQQRDILKIAHFIATLVELCKMEIYTAQIEQIFLDVYDISHGDTRDLYRDYLSLSDTNKLRRIQNVAMLFANLLYFDAITQETQKSTRYPVDIYSILCATWVAGRFWSSSVLLKSTRFPK